MTQKHAASTEVCPLHAEPAASSRSSAVRWLLAALGLACFGLGALGAILPGLPTTIFVIAGSYFLTRSCPWLERRLRELPLLRPYVKYLDPTTPFTPSARRRALAAMWLSIAVTTTVLAWRGTVPVAVLVAIPLSGLVGTWAILQFRRVRHPGRTEV
jgi:uncharacterized membrane protein YbaN (DUF454 family)